jgi:hypothetical protein
MKARNIETDSLAFLWAQRRKIRRALFFSYRFNFRWFHDFVLPHLPPESELIVLASRFGDENEVFAGSAPGDLYGIEQWARWQDRFRIRYLPAEPVTYHCKFMLLELEGRLEPILGGGSANLTSSGWGRNQELWSWDEKQALGACRAYLNAIRNEVGSDIVMPWIKRLPIAAPQLPWLFGSKRLARAAAWSYLCAPSIGIPRKLTIASPYFDQGSELLLNELLAHIAQRLGHTPTVELIIDGSAQVGRRSDYSHVLKLSQRKNVKIAAPSQNGDSGRSFLPLHMKALQLHGTLGHRTLFGSANFTSAAWKGLNHETLFAAPKAPPLDTLWSDGQDLQHVDPRRLKRLLTTAADDQPGDKSLNFVYWATFDERELELTLSASRIDEIARIEVEAECDPRRQGDERHRLLNIATAFSAINNWSAPAVQGHVLKIAQKARRQLPERLRVRVIWKDDSAASGPVEVLHPDFTDLRDPESGMPWDLSEAISGLCGVKRAIATRLMRKSTRDADEDVDEEDISPEPEISTLSADVEYHHIPEGISLAKAISKASPERRQEMLRLISIRKPIAQDPASQLLLEATRLALQEE